MRISILVFLLAATEAHAAEILILAGDATQDGGKKAFEATTAAWKRWEYAIIPAPGYPKLIESGSVLGLKPGFWITVLGVCEKQGTLLDAARATVKGPYVRQVKWPDATLPCPETKNLIAKSTKTKHGELLVVSSDYGSRIVLIAKDGTITADEPIKGPFGQGCDGKELTAGGGIVALDAHCITQSCTQPEEADVTVEIRAKSPTEIMQRARSVVTVKCIND